MKKDALYFLDKISARFPDAKIELDYDRKDPFTLLVAVMLSAQTTDVNVNKATPALFKAFKDVRAFARATPEEVEPYVRSLGFFRNKAKAVCATARRLVDEFGGKVPSERAVLETLPGVGAKTAAVVVANIFGEPAIAVDTHVARVAQRLGLTKETNPDKIERDLTRLFPRNRLVDAHHTFIWHGRRICKARKPLCSECPVQERCPKIGVTTSA
jgi:endonuclease-3